MNMQAGQCYVDSAATCLWRRGGQAISSLHCMHGSWGPHGCARLGAFDELTSKNCCRFDAYIPEAYERLILDAIQGNQQHFVRRDELRASWAMFTPILHDIDAAKGPKMQRYEYGSRAVEAGEKLIKESGYVRSSNYNWKSSNGEREA